MKLVIGNKNYSSWSLRAWLLLAAHDIPFDEIRIALFTGNWRSELAGYTGAGKVPVLVDGEITVWDSLAICEYVSERYLDGKGWPADREARALARACSAEMHSGFFELRGKMPMNCRAGGRRVTVTPELKAEIGRIETLWSEMRARYSARGAWLFGEFSIADCLFAPVASRFATYGVELSGESAAYGRRLLEHPAVRRWYEQARAETETIAASEAGLK